jgi:hypothetical protein
MASPPKRVNAGERETTQYAVPNANDRDVEREQQNRINKKLRELIEEIETSGNGEGSFPPGGVTDHGDLTGLSNDDHLHYHTNYRAFVWLLATLLPQSGVEFEDDAGVPEINLYILTSTGTATEALTAGRFVNLDASGQVQHASSDDNEKVAMGFILESYADAASDVRVYYGAENNDLSGLTPGDHYYLSTDGEVTDTPPTGNSPVFVQQLGVAKSATSLLVNIQQPIERPTA